MSSCSDSYFRDSSYLTVETGLSPSSPYATLEFSADSLLSCCCHEGHLCCQETQLELFPLELLYEPGHLKI